jgi:hypothetical protein
VVLYEATIIEQEPRKQETTNLTSTPRVFDPSISIASESITEEDYEDELSENSSWQSENTIIFVPQAAEARETTRSIDAIVLPGSGVATSISRPATMPPTFTSFPSVASLPTKLNFHEANYDHLEANDVKINTSTLVLVGKCTLK